MKELGMLESSALSDKGCVRSNNEDYCLIEPELGLYVLAFNISGWPVNVFGAVVRSVSLPGFARLRADAARLPERCAAALKTVAWVTFPACVLLGALGRPIVVGNEHVHELPP